jgi:hypothetical protein
MKGEEISVLKKNWLLGNDVDHPGYSPSIRLNRKNFHIVHIVKVSVVSNIAVEAFELILVSRKEVFEIQLLNLVCQR